VPCFIFKCPSSHAGRHDNSVTSVAYLSLGACLLEDTVLIFSLVSKTKTVAQSDTGRRFMLLSLYLIR
jgi:hypothetical protein